MPRQRSEDIEIKYQKSIHKNKLQKLGKYVETDHGHKPKHAEEIRRTRETIQGKTNTRTQQVLW